MKPPAEFATCVVPGMGADCAGRRVMRRCRYDIRPPFVVWAAAGSGRPGRRLGPLALRVELGLCCEAETEALERADERVDLVPRVLTQARRRQVELEPDLVHAVRDRQPDPRVGRLSASTARRPRGCGL